MVQQLGLLGVLLFAPLAVPAPEANVTGNWNVTISIHDGTIIGKASFKQDGRTVTGWVGPGAQDPIPITGVLEGNKLTIQTHPQPGRSVAFHRCDVSVDGNKMSGTVDTDKGKIEFVKNTP